MTARSDTTVHPRVYDALERLHADGWHFTPAGACILVKPPWGQRAEYISQQSLAGESDPEGYIRQCVAEGVG